MDLYFLEAVSFHHGVAGMCVLVKGRVEEREKMRCSNTCFLLSEDICFHHVGGMLCCSAMEWILAAVY